MRAQDPADGALQAVRRVTLVALAVLGVASSVLVAALLTLVFA